MGDESVVNIGKSESAVKEVIHKLAQQASQPYQLKSKSMICSFYVKGNCKRDADCPFRHEMPEQRRKRTGANKAVSLQPDPLLSRSKAPRLNTDGTRRIPPPPPKGQYPSQDPTTLGTSTRSFRQRD